MRRLTRQIITSMICHHTFAIREIGTPGVTISTLNYQNVMLPLSGAPQYWFSATASGQTIVGNSGNDALYGVGGDTLVGGSGDDTFYVNGSDRVIVAPGGDVDTIVTYWGGYTLPDDVQNLVVQGDGAYGVGNSLDNVIEAVGPGEITLDGGGGNNVLAGGTGETIFVHTVGDSNDVIDNFAPGLDKVRLENTSLYTFAAVESQMQQVGSDVVLHLGSSDSITFRNVELSQFSSQDFMLPLDYTKLHMSFDDEFNALNLSNGSSGTWSTAYWWAPANGATNTSNGELGWYINAAYAPTASVKPWAVNNGILDITAAPASASIQPLIDNYQYTSGMLTTHDSFVQTYGVYEISAKVPAGQGLWADFWLLPENGSWPPELDVMEINGGNPDVLDTAVHTASTGQNTTISNGTPIADASAGFHTYAVDWEPDTITWYVDGNEVFQTATPADMHQPMYMLLDLAVGGPYGNPNASTQFPATFQVDYVRAYATAAAAPVISQISGAMTGNQITLTGTAEGDSTVNIYEDNTLIGTAAANGVGAWSFAAGVPANGSHNFTATDTNAANNTSPTSAALNTSVSVIQTDGATSLTEIANQYFYLELSGGSGTSLKYQGAVANVAEFNPWTPIGAVQTATGFDVAWKNTSTGQYTVWATDPNGNFTVSLTAAVSGATYALESLEPVFHQDLNGDGVIGPTQQVIQTDGSTSLTEVASQYFYLDGRSGTGPALKYNGSNVTVGEFPGWTPIGAVQTASGFDVAWKDAGTNQYTAWATDANGNYTASLIGAVSPTNTTLESLEAVFGQDLNGDGVTGLYAAPGTTLQISSALAGPSGASTIGIGAMLELAAADSSSVTFQGSTGTLRLDHSSTFSGTLFNFTGNGSLSGSDQIDLRDIHYASAHYNYANGVLTVSDGSGDHASLSFSGSYTLANFEIANDGSGGTVVYDPPTLVAPTGSSHAPTTAQRNNAMAHSSLGGAAGANLPTAADAFHFDRAQFASCLAAGIDGGHGHLTFQDFTHPATTHASFS
jgi:beta-glucanase (GH16 family)